MADTDKIPVGNILGNSLGSTEILIGLAVQFLLAIMMCSISVMLFELVRARHPWIYAPKYFSDIPRIKKRSNKDGKFSSRSGYGYDGFDPEKDDSNATLINPGNKWFSWLTVRNKDELLLSNAGLDAIMYLKTIKLGTKFFLMLSVLSALIWIPINVSSSMARINAKSDTESTAEDTFGVHTLSIAGIPIGSPQLMAPAFATLISTAIGCWLLLKQWREFAALRRELYHQELERKKVRPLSIMILETPKDLADEKTMKRIIHKNLSTDLKKSHARNIQAIYVDRDIMGLGKLIEERNKYLAELERLVIRFVILHQRKSNGYLLDSDESMLTRWITKYRAWRSVKTNQKKASNAVHNIVGNSEEVLGQSISIDTLSNVMGKLSKVNFSEFESHKYVVLLSKIEELATQIKYSDMEIEVRRDQYQKWNRLQEAKDRQSSVFVTFKDRLSATYLMNQGHLNYAGQILDLHQSPNPEPRDLLWRNVSIPRKKRLALKILVGILVAILVGFYLVPVTAIIGLTDLKKIAADHPSVEKFASKIWIVAITQTVIPTILLAACMNFLQFLLSILTRMERPVCMSDCFDGIMTKYYYFELFNVLFAFTIGSSIFNFISDFVHDPYSRFMNLAEILPRNAHFFVNYIVLNIGLSAIEIMQFRRIFKQYFYWLMTYKTPRDKFLLKNQRAFLEYSTWYPFQLLIFIIALTYSPIYPIITFFAALFFGFNQMLFGYQVQYVYVPQFESGGKFYTNFAFPKIMQGFVIQQLVMLAFLVLKKAYVIVSLISIPTMVGTFWFYHFCQKKFQSSDYYGFYEIKNEKDLLDSRDEEISIKKSSQNYTDEDSNKLIPSMYDPQTYEHPALHQPLPQLWLPKWTKDCIADLLIIRGQSKLS